MAPSTRSDFMDIIHPLYERLGFYDATKPSTDQPLNDSLDSAKAIPQAFLDAMAVRERVFVQEQGVPLENELDEDDPRSFHWVVYASVPAKTVSPEAEAQNGQAENQKKRQGSNSTKVPIGTIRLVPPPHAPHPTPGSRHTSATLSVSTSATANDASEGDSDKGYIAVHDGKEAYIKLGRMAVIPEYRKAGISKLLMETALSFARQQPYEIVPLYDPARFESMRQEAGRGAGLDWKGLVLVHAQVGVQKVYKRYGFDTDESMGQWEEEGIQHVAMWKRLDIEPGRRKSKVWPLGSPIASP